MNYRVKVLLASLALVSSAAFAADECPVWIYKNYKACANTANGYDLSKLNPTKYPDHFTYTRTGGLNSSDQAGECSRLTDELNKNSASSGKHVTWLTVDSNKEKADKQWDGTKYTYWCDTVYQTYAANASGPACGQEDVYTQQNGGSGENLPDGAKCLSCDNISDIDAKAQCLVDSIKQFKVDKAPDTSRLDLHDSDWAKVDANLEKVRKAEKFTSVPALKDSKNLDILLKYDDLKKQ